VFTLPKLLRPIFSRHRACLGELCRIWHVVGGHETSATTEVISPVREERAD